MELNQQLILESFQPVYFWRYTSYVTDWLFWEDPKNLSAYWINVFGQIKENVMERGYELVFKDNRFPTQVSHNWDNKVVVELHNKYGAKLFMGWKDGNLCLGFGRGGDEWVLPAKIL